MSSFHPAKAKEGKLQIKIHTNRSWRDVELYSWIHWQSITMYYIVCAHINLFLMYFPSWHRKLSSSSNTLEEALVNFQMPILITDLNRYDLCVPISYTLKSYCYCSSLFQHNYRQNNANFVCEDFYVVSWKKIFVLQSVLQSARNSLVLTTGIVPLGFITTVTSILDLIPGDIICEHLHLIPKYFPSCYRTINLHDGCEKLFLKRPFAKLVVAVLQ